MQQQHRRGSTGRSPLILIVILVYAAFLATALVSIMVFFPQVTLPGTLRLPVLRLPERAAQAPPAGAAAPAAPTAPAAPATPVAPQRPEPISRAARALEGARNLFASLRWPDVGAWARGAWSSVTAWLRGLEWPDVAALFKRAEQPASQPPEVARTAPQVPTAERAPEPAPAPPPAVEAPRVAPVSPAVAGEALPVPSAPPAGAPDAEALRRAYEARLREADEKHAREMAALQQTLDARAGAKVADTVRRYNPVFEQAGLAAMLRGGVDRSLFGAEVSAPYREILEREGIMSRAQYDQLRGRAAELDALAGRLLQVPYTNSVPPALERIRESGQSLARDYGRIWTALAERLQARDARIGRLQGQIDQFAVALDQLARSSREGGYILDPRDPQSILLYISRLHDPKVGDTVYVFRKEDELVATLRITAVGDGVRASLVQQAEAGKPMVAFDRILLASAEEIKG